MGRRGLLAPSCLVVVSLLVLTALTGGVSVGSALAAPIEAPRQQTAPPTFAATSCTVPSGDTSTPEGMQAEQAYEVCQNLGMLGDRALILIGFAFVSVVLAFGLVSVSLGKGVLGS